MMQYLYIDYKGEEEQEIVNYILDFEFENNVELASKEDLEWLTGYIYKYLNDKIKEVNKIISKKGYGLFAESEGNDFYQLFISDLHDRYSDDDYKDWIKEDFSTYGIGEFGERMAEIVRGYNEKKFGSNISWMFRSGRRGVDMVCLKKDKPSTLSIFEIKSSIYGEMCYSDLKKLSGKKYFEYIIEDSRIDKRYFRFSENLRNIEKENCELLYDYCRIEMIVDASDPKCLAVENLKVKYWLDTIQ